MQHDINLRKVVIIGDGMVGSSIAFSLVSHSDVTHICIIDIDEQKVEGDVLDLKHASTFSFPKEIRVGNYASISDAHIIIITAGVTQKPGESRLDLIHKNKLIIESIANKMKPFLNKKSIVLMVTNPVDLLTYHIANLLDLPKSQIIGSGTVLDTARLKYLLSEDTGVDARNIHAYVIGEHGDSELVPYSCIYIAGVSLLSYCQTCKCHNCDNVVKLDLIADRVTSSAYQIISLKGSTYYGVAAAVNRIVDAIIKDSHSVLTVSTYIFFGMKGKLKDIYLSVPSIVGSKGVVTTLWPQYTIEEENLLLKSYIDLKNHMRLANI